ncbi:hypothetical protein CERSUDRAFT_119155 [Gelatoporia subvermispora B]|uniref:Enhancer of polycomb-like protein n=1 Tax=Ceriporiopsis subvermispora (strain B) TaxID=914234 RepID=M2QIG1_CERS8|nr:hypothetical protein CERSUDRAFT_119155 [Gelatoporia subvermispora B]
MPRNHTAGPSTLRNRNRVTNKTRLRIITESIDADPIVIDEDEEKARVVSTAGVDAEDANEHHLQAVLSAAATRHQVTRSTRTAGKEASQPAAYIPTPDSTGLVDNYTELYPPSRWRDPSTYVKSSDTVEESISYALADGFIYYMDERDKEWLDKNNEEARGEGTSAQGAVSGTSTRSGRSTKGKGKDPDVAQPTTMSEDEFELVMAVFEKVTHEKTEFLHHGLEQGSQFPPFSDYQDIFATKLSPSMFATFVVPDWVLEPEALLRMARVVYPYWRDRRLERGGHRIIPTVNLDETDTKNESYICFRRREIKAVRKTRAQQAPYADKMRRLQSELGITLTLAESVRDRERFKREQAAQGQAVWERRLTLVDLKRKFPTLGVKEDDELFFDKEKVAKKPKTETTGRIPLKLRTRDNAETASPVTHAEPQIKPKERQAMIQSQIEQELARRKEKDQRWDDVVDNPYQALPVPYPSRLFKIIPPPKSSASPWLDEEPDESEREYRAVRMRYGRGGRLHVDRRSLRRRTGRPVKRGSTHPWLTQDDPGDEESRQHARILEERWRYDGDDDGPATGPEGVDEKDRILVDDYDPKYLVRQAGLLTEQDCQSLLTDPTLIITAESGQKQAVVPFRLGLPALPRRDVQISQRPGPSPTTPSHTGSRPLGASIRLSPVANGVHGTPVAMQTQIRNMPPPSLPHMRISSNGGMRPPVTPQVPAMLANISTPLMTPSPHSTPPNSAGHVNGFPDATSRVPDGTEHDLKQGVHASPNGIAHLNGDQPHADAAVAVASTPVTPSTSPLRPKTQVPQPVSIPAVPTTNGYHLTPYAAMSNGAYAMHPNMRHNGLSAQHVQMKTAFASMSPSPDASQPNAATMPIRPPTSYMPHVMNGAANYQMQQLAQQRMPWMVAAQQQRSPSVHAVDANGVGVDGLGSPSLSPALAGVAPPRTPSANGMRNGALPRAVPVPNAGQFIQGQGRASPANAHIARLAPPSPSPHMLSPSLAASQVQSSPTRAPQPALASPSPSLQPRQVVGSSGAGY